MPRPFRFCTTILQIVIEHSLNIMGQILLTPSDPDSYSVGAKILRAVRVGNNLNLLFCGTDPENGETYEGALQLECKTELQTVQAEYTNKPLNHPKDKPLEPRKFTLVGKFIDSSFDYFEGSWIEPDFTLDCTIEEISAEHR